MKKNLLLLSAFTLLVSSLNVQAQTSTLKVLVDSLPNAGYGIIESFNNKLYSLPAIQGGKVSEINTTTGIITTVATLPTLSTSNEYSTYSGNFIFLKGKTVASINNTSGGTTYHIAAGISTVDTLLTDHMAFGPILNVDTMAFILTRPKTLTSNRLYATNLVNPIKLIDTNIYNNGGADEQIMKAENQKKLYYVVRLAGTSKYVLKTTNGISSATIETVPNYLVGGFSLIGEIGSDMYFTSYSRNASMDTTFIKKCDVSGIVTILDTVLRNNSFSSNGGLVMDGNILIIPFYKRIITYNLTTHKKEEILPGKFARTYDWSQSYVAKNHFYFNIITDSTYISDGTSAGTLPYTTSTGRLLGVECETYGSYNLLGNKGVICDEYPIGNRDDELYIGNVTNAVQYKLFPSRKSFPSHFEKVDDAVFFTVHDAAYRKFTLMKLEGCDTPITNPLAIKETLKNNAIVCSIFPNPSDGVFNIDTKADLQSVAVYNLLGAKVFFNNDKSTIKEIDLSRQSSGSYFIKMMDKNGAVSTQKIQLLN